MPWDKFFFIQVFDNFGWHTCQNTVSIRKTFCYYCSCCNNRSWAKSDTGSNHTVHSNP